MEGAGAGNNLGSELMLVAASASPTGIKLPSIRPVITSTSKTLMNPFMSISFPKR
jgi:hypothetical protein